jgi:hypothetical protein
VEQHFQDQIEYILNKFNFFKMRQVMIGLNWTWRGEAFSPSADRLRDRARSLLESVAASDMETTYVETGGFLAQKIDGHRLRLFFVVERADSTDIVGDEGPTCVQCNVRPAMSDYPGKEKRGGKEAKVCATCFCREVGITTEADL